MRPQIYFLLTLATSALVVGCSSNEPDIANLGTLQGSQKTADDANDPVGGLGLADVLSSWSSGDKDGAVQQLVSMDWNKPNIATGTPLSLSEQEFTSLSASERNRIQQEALEFSATSRQVGQHAASLGEQALASGDNENAKVYYDAVLRFGQAMAKPDRLFAVKSVGNVLLTIANEKLSGMN